MTRFQIVLFGFALLLCLACDQATKQVGETRKVWKAVGKLEGAIRANPGGFR